MESDRAGDTFVPFTTSTHDACTPRGSGSNAASRVVALPRLTSSVGGVLVIILLALVGLILGLLANGLGG